MASGRSGNAAGAGLKVLIDMNLSPRWAEFLKNRGIDAVHWSEVGDAWAPDERLFKWARNHGFIVFTHDFDFSALLWKTHQSGPSVIQIRTQRVTPNEIGNALCVVLVRYANALNKGALVTIDIARGRVRLLPLGKPDPI